MNEGSPLPNPESKIDVKDLYLKPYVIAEQIRALKEAVEKWHIANDFVQLLERNLNDLTLEEEDEGLRLNASASKPSFDDGEKL